MTQSQRVEAYLQTHPGATAMELSFGLQPYVSNVRARISDLRKQGIAIEARRRGDGQMGFYLVRDGTLGLVS